MNLTPHAVRVVLDKGRTQTFDPSGTVARVTTASRTVADLGGIPCDTTVYFGIDGLPPVKPGVAYIASAMVAQRAWSDGRYDVVHPGDLLRDDAGNVIGCRNFTVSPKCPWRDDSSEVSHV
ncbi:MAG: hypothetical protein ACO25T_08775 [Arenimonas sp.]